MTWLWIRPLAKNIAVTTLFALALGFLPLSSAMAAPEFSFRPPSSGSDPAASAIMRDLAARIIPVYHEADPDRYLADLSALQMAVGDYAAADLSRQSLRDRLQQADGGRPPGQAVVYDIYAHAKALEAQNRITFAEAFANAYRESIRRLSDRDDFTVMRWLGEPAAPYQEALQQSLDQQRAQDSIDQAGAIELIWKFIAFDAYRTLAPMAGLLASEDEQRRYSVNGDVLVKTADGARISVVVVRPNGAAGKLPALLEFRIDELPGSARECAAHGYVGVVAYVRGRKKSSPGFTPFEHDGADARAVINWIAKQSWSDGRVGMYGEGYGGYIPWAAANHPPRALKAIATAASIAPGINFPMEGNIPKNSAYGWSLEMEGGASPGRIPDDFARWRALDEKWYRSGARYRDLGQTYGTDNPVFIRWQNHPSYDKFWQDMVPYREQFAQVAIPVLIMTGYFASSEPGDLYLFAEHQRHNPSAGDALLMGPYDDAMLQSAPAANLHGYELDAAALIDFRELRYQWFDHVFRGTAAPPLVTSGVNYEVMGANDWQHAPTLEGMSERSIRLYLERVPVGSGHRLTLQKKTNSVFVEQKVGFVDRSDAAWMPPTDFISKGLAPRHGTIYISEPLSKAVQIGGSVSGRLDFAINKMDVDLSISLYELLANGDYVRLFSPTNEFRASYAQDRSHRHLLNANVRQQLAFKAERLSSRLLQAGSRLVMVLGINIRPDREINYGTGDDVSEESIADGQIPLKIRWYSDSYIDVPVQK